MNSRTFTGSAFSPAMVSNGRSVNGAPAIGRAELNCTAVTPTFANGLRGRTCTTNRRRAAGVALQRPIRPTRLLQIAEDVNFTALRRGGAGLGLRDRNGLGQVGGQFRRLHAVERLEHVFQPGRRPREKFLRAVRPVAGQDDRGAVAGPQFLNDFAGGGAGAVEQRHAVLGVPHAGGVVEQEDDAARAAAAEGGRGRRGQQRLGDGEAEQGEQGHAAGQKQYFTDAGSSDKSGGTGR